MTVIDLGGFIETDEPITLGSMVLGKYSKRAGIVTQINHEKGCFTAELFPTNMSQRNSKQEFSTDWNCSKFIKIIEKEEIFWNLYWRF